MRTDYDPYVCRHCGSGDIELIWAIALYHFYNSNIPEIVSTCNHCGLSGHARKSAWLEKSAEKCDEC